MSRLHIDGNGKSSVFRYLTLRGGASINQSDLAGPTKPFLLGSAFFLPFARRLLIGISKFFQRIVIAVLKMICHDGATIGRTLEIVRETINDKTFFVEHSNIQRYKGR